MVDDFDRGLTAPAPQSGDVESRPRGQFNRRHYRTLESQGRLRQRRVIEKNHNGSLELSRQIGSVQLLCTIGWIFVKLCDGRPP